MNTTMNPEVKAKWLEALRSGKYKQGKFMLRNQYDGYCCLGVLCDLYGKETGVEFFNTKTNMLGAPIDQYTFLGSPALPGKEVTDWAGLRENNPLVVAKDGNRVNLVTLNDQCDTTFAEIADLVEEQL